MTHYDPLDDFVRRNTARVDLGGDRMDRLTAATLARLPEHRKWREALRAWWPEVASRYALPMATAAVLGIIVGSHVLPANPPQQVGFFVSSSFALAGF